jgi:gamma-glutamylaminecyclotransferase
VDALVYIAEDGGFGSPRLGYLERVLAGARHHGLPVAAIAEIESWGKATPNSAACTVNVFVYGTLKRGHCNHVYIADGIFVGEAVTADRFALHVQGLPRVDRDNPVSPIHGELYRVSTMMLTEIDRLEGHPHCYRRSRVSVRLVDGTVVAAWLYFYPSPDGPIELSGRFVSS